MTTIIFFFLLKGEIEKKYQKNGIKLEKNSISQIRIEE
jgi:hypothetical protein